MIELLNSLPDAFWNNPGTAINMLVSLLAVAIVYVTLRNADKQNVKAARENARRMNECEDAHLVRDEIQISTIDLMARLQAALKQTTGGRRTAIDPSGFVSDGAELLAQMRNLNKEMKDRRQRERPDLAQDQA